MTFHLIMLVLGLLGLGFSAVWSNEGLAENNLGQALFWLLMAVGNAFNICVWLVALIKDVAP